MLKKCDVQYILDRMPDTFTAPDFIDKIIEHKIQLAVEESERGEGINWEDLKKEMEKW
jgi:hypothetical protein